jgi:hypothetical protein
MADYEVKCVNKIPRNDPYDRINYIGINTLNGVKKYTVAEIVNFIEMDGHRFFVSKNGKSVFLKVGISPNNNKYVKTEDDGQPLNNLLSLPECI